MAKSSDRLAGVPDAKDDTGVLSDLVADESQVDRRTLWRVGSWGFTAVAAVIVAIAASHSSMGWRREQAAAVDLSRQAQQIQLLTRESQNETRRLASAIDTLNGDRDRLFSRITVLEQGLDSVTGAIAKQTGAAIAPPQAAAKAPISPVTDGPTAAAPAVASVWTTGPGAPTPSEKPRVERPRAEVAAAPKPPAAVWPPSDGQTSSQVRSAALAFASISAAGLGAPGLPVEEPHVELPKAEPNATMAVALPAAASFTPQATPPTPMGTGKSMMGPPDPAAPKLIETSSPANLPVAVAIPAPAASPPGKEPTAAEADPFKGGAVQRTEFAIDLGRANSVGGLRALWRGLLKTNPELGPLHPIIVVKESNTGLGMQLRLAAGPLQDAATAAKICAALLEAQRGCETTVFDGQRLTMAADDAAPAARDLTAVKPGGAPKRASPKAAKKDEQPSPPPETSGLSALWKGSH